MIEDIVEPAAFAVVRWLSPAQGGRRSGPPAAPVYAATCIFPLGDVHEVHPDWPRGVEQLSILLAEVERLPNDDRVCKVRFLVPDLAQPFLHPGAEILVMEGPKIVGNAVIREVVTDAN
jgi:hypothetical protein